MSSDEKIQHAIRALAMGMGFRRVENGAILYWGDTELFYPCDAGEPVLTAVAVGAIHSLVCHNVTAILDGKTNFDVNIGGKITTLPVRIPQIREPQWTYPVIDWRFNSDTAGDSST